MKNRYEIRGDITAIFLESKVYGNMETIIDTADLARVQEFPNTWNAYWNVRTFYVAGKIQINKKRTLYPMHRWIMSPPTNLVVDHKNHDTLDNRRLTNLRNVTNAQNMQNIKGPSSRNKSGVRGVNWHKKEGKWRAALTLNGKHVHIGLFEDLDQARIAVESVRQELMPFSKGESA